MLLYQHQLVNIYHHFSSFFAWKPRARESISFAEGVCDEDQVECTPPTPSPRSPKPISLRLSLPDVMTPPSTSALSATHKGWSIPLSPPLKSIHYPPSPIKSPIKSPLLGSILSPTGSPHPHPILSPITSLSPAPSVWHSQGLSIASYMIPHDNKITTGGEDAYFVSSVATGGEGVVLGVFDGVGGWAAEGVDPRDYPRSLVKGCLEVLESVGECCWEDEDEEMDAMEDSGPCLPDPLKVMTYGYNKSKHILGSSTACILTIDGSTLLAANLGDSGLRVIRKDQVVLSSTPQQHRFNTPYQLGPDSDDRPEDSELLSFGLKEGDVVVVGTDGLFDNLFDENIVKVVERGRPCPMDMAAELAKKAYRISKKENVRNPFNELAAKCDIPTESSGKQDDITVIVAIYQGKKDDW